jgi:imidazolonepropionase-like amidohydrolase
MLAHSVRDLPVDDELIRLIRARDICYSPTLMREVSTFVYESTPAFFEDAFFVRHADRPTVDGLKTPARQAQVKASKSAQRYKVGLEQASRNLKTLKDAGVRIAMGTDTGPVGRFQGYFEHLELEMMVKAGLTPMQAVMAATGDAARCIGKSGEVGSLQKGAWADFLVFGASPLEDIRNTRSLRTVYIGGEALSAQGPAGR